MFSHPRRQEIDHRTMKLIVGLIALSLASLTSFFAHTPIASISASYYEGGWSQTIFIGFLFAIGAFMLAYNGDSRLQMIVSKIAAMAALAIALFPCECDRKTPVAVPYVHGIAAAIMFAILALFCYFWFRSALRKDETHATRRAVIYAGCGIAILASILTLALDKFLHHAISSQIPRLTFYGERTGLVAFGISWLTASHWLPVLASKSERFAARNQDVPPADAGFAVGEYSA